MGWLALTKGAPPTQSDIDAQALRAQKTVQPFRPVQPLDRDILSSIDMAKVHGQLLPAWFISLQHSPHSIGRTEAEAAFRALRDEVGKDPNLGLLLGQLHESLMNGTYDFRGEVRALFKGWNEYLAQGGVPFRMEYRIDRTPHGPAIRVRCYRVVADVPVLDQHSTLHVLLLARQDRTNLIEGFLGQTSPDRGTALVMTDRIAEYAIDQLWPLFAPHDESSELALVTMVRKEARLALGESATGVLARSFAVHHALRAELSSLANRRGCGSGVLIERVPWDGLSERTLAMVNGVARKNDSRHCTRVTQRDADRVSSVSQQLREHAELESALATLGGWVARAVVAHESRHLADDESTQEAGGTNLCHGCPASFDDKTRAEVAAYLASFATAGVGYVALFQACGNDPERRGAHSVALDLLLPRLLAAGCTGPIPEDLRARAAALRAELIGRSDTVEVPKGLPASIPVPHG